MKKVVLEDDSSSKHIKEGKVKKNKQKKEKKFKDAPKKINDPNLTPKNESAKLVKLKNNAADENKKIKKKKTSKKEKDQESTEEIEKLTFKIKRQKILKGDKYNQDHAQVSTPSKKITEAEIMKIEKKSKLDKKFKKQRKKTEIISKIKSDAVTTKIIQETKILDSGLVAAESECCADNASSRVLTKKKKKAQKRQLIKDWKIAEKQTRNPAMAAATVFVGNMPVSTKRTHLIRLFKDFGGVNNIRLRTADGKVLFKHKQRKSAGSLNAYVVLKTKETAEKAVSLNGIEFRGHHLRVTLLSNNNLSYEKQGKRTVFVGNLKNSATEESLHEIFSNCGEIDYIRCIRGGDKGCNGIAYVCFKKADAVGLALELNATIVDERPINVERYSVNKLGAKKKREAQDEKENYKKGAKRRLDAKKGKKEKSGHKKENHLGIDDTKKQKKSEFRGVKVDNMKKKQKSKKKKSGDQMLQLAKKIAPRTKTK